MFGTDAADSVAVKPAKDPAGSSGWFTDVPPGTVVDHDWANMITDELISLVTNVGGLSLDKTDDGQLEEVLHHIRALRSDVADLISETSLDSVALIASQGCDVGGNGGGASAWSAVVASTQSDCTPGGGGSERFIAACFNTDIASAVVRSCALASSDCDVTGSGSLVASSANGADASGQASAAIGTLASDASGLRSVAVASESSTTPGTNVAAAGVDACTVDGDESAIVASDDSTTAAGEARSLVGGSTNVDNLGTNLASLASGSSLNNGGASVLTCGFGVELATQYALAGGYNLPGTKPVPAGADQGLTILLDFGNFKAGGANGNIYADGVIGAGLADLAELFENCDCDRGQVPDGSVVTLEGRKVRLAEAGDRVAGIVSAAPAFVGNSAPLAWSGKYRRDEFGRIELVEGEDGHASPAISESFDGSQVYRSRLERPDEWTAVALTGQVRARVSADVVPNDLLEAGPGGIARPGDGVRGDRRLELLELVEPFDKARGYAIGLVLVG